VGEPKVGWRTSVRDNKGMGLIYVIEDEPVLRQGLIEALGNMPGVQTYGFGMVQDAVDALDGHPPDLILTGLNLPERCGLDMLGELDARGLTPSMVLISGYLEEYREYIPDRPGLTVLARPFDLNVLLEHVQQVFTTQSAEQPPAHSFGLLEYLKLACLGAHTVEILVCAEGPSNDLIGRVVVLGGQLWSVQDPQGMGAEAFLRLACLPVGAVACNEIQRTALMRNVYQAWDSLVAAAVARRDGTASNLQFALNPNEPALGFHPPGPFEPPRPLKCAPQSSDTGSLATRYDEADIGVLAPETAPTLHDFLAAASAAEAGGASADAIQHLEGAMACYPGHPEILLWLLRLKG
jgi:CheY-like chemotaxis protein